MPIFIWPMGWRTLIDTHVITDHSFTPSWHSECWNGSISPLLGNCDYSYYYLMTTILIIRWSNVSFTHWKDTQCSAQACQTLVSRSRDPPKAIKLLEAWNFFCIQVLRTKTVSGFGGGCGSRSMYITSKGDERGTLDRVLDHVPVTWHSLGTLCP